MRLNATGHAVRGVILVVMLIPCYGADMVAALCRGEAAAMHRQYVADVRRWVSKIRG